MIHTIRFWLNNARTTALAQSLLPAVLAFCMATQVEGFSAGLGFMAVIGAMLAHLSMNLFDDYFDYRIKGSEFRDAMARKGFRARISKCAYLTTGKATLKQLLIACIVFSAVACMFGAVIWWFRGNAILWLTLIAGILGVSYSGAPLRLSYHGLGELVIGLLFGPMLMAGVYYAACGHFDWPVAFVSVPVGLLVANVVYTHAIMDYEPDKEVGKMTFAVLLKSKKRMLAASFFILFAPFAVIIGGVVSGYLSPCYLLTLLGLPMAVSLFYLMTAFVRRPEKKFRSRWWMGPMENWQAIQQANLDWFMIRWYLSRNLLSFFCLIIILIVFIF
ncbi:MAG: prenyltransferase [Candidatus Symbiothrix sp.]|jgi:1,4-dihydroxy-2-naphthoate octaprenyltransferase|nr:prenyltransferase [Candidatus Symbiothrix sp.]